MGIKQWNAGIIRPIPVAPTGPYQDGSAPGVWTLDQVSYWLKQGLWPIAGNVAPTSLFFGGNTASGATNVIDYVLINTAGNAIDFGDLSATKYAGASCSSSSRGVFGGGFVTGPTAYNVIEYVSYASKSNTTDFGDLLSVLFQLSACASSTRGIFAGGDDLVASAINVIQYITISTAGNSSDFGDLTKAWESMGSCASSTRGVFGGGSYDGNNTNRIDYVTIASAGNSTYFGDLLSTTDSGLDNPTACSNSTRGIFFIGLSGASYSNTIEYITIASTGNATDFGDLPIQSQSAGAASASATRGLIGGGQNGGSSYLNVVSYVTITTTGNASNFGDLTIARRNLSSCSNAHGGL